VKLSEQAIKVSNPGVQQVRRYQIGSMFLADMIFDETRPGSRSPIIVDPKDSTRRKVISEGTAHEDLLVPIFRRGQRVYQCPTLDESRRRCIDQLGRLHDGIRRFANPHEYPVGLELGLHQLKTDLVLKARRIDQP
jgi:nicotinate phosphoribosyltransferase